MQRTGAVKPQTHRLCKTKAMTTVSEHYEDHLAPIYLWMAGGFDAALARGTSEVDAICPAPSKGQIAVDLGAGFGMHSIPLAQRGLSVVAVDSSPLLLATLRDHAGPLTIRTVEDDLLHFQEHLDKDADFILCMGDTLTHLATPAIVRQLFTLVAESLQPGGQFVTTFRDYTSALTGDARFIPVRSDADRILTCFLEYAPDEVTVHDILQERQGSTWQMRVSSYRKLRLAPTWVSAELQGRGFSVRVEPGLAGMVRIVATRVGGAMQ